jgi:hypothetical protein
MTEDVHTEPEEVEPELDEWADGDRTGPAIHNARLVLQRQVEALQASAEGPNPAPRTAETERPPQPLASDMPNAVLGERRSGRHRREPSGPVAEYQGFRQREPGRINGAAIVVPTDERPEVSPLTAPEPDAVQGNSEVKTSLGEPPMAPVADSGGTSSSAIAEPDPPSTVPTPVVRIRLLGQPAILDSEGAPVPGLRRHALQVLLYLALYPEGPRSTP